MSPLFIRSNLCNILWIVPTCLSTQLLQRKTLTNHLWFSSYVRKKVIFVTRRPPEQMNGLLLTLRRDVTFSDVCQKIEEDMLLSLP